MTHLRTKFVKLPNHIPFKANFLKLTPGVPINVQSESLNWITAVMLIGDSSAFFAENESDVTSGISENPQALKIAYYLLRSNSLPEMQLLDRNRHLRGN